MKSVAADKLEEHRRITTSVSFTAKTGLLATVDSTLE